MSHTSESHHLIAAPITTRRGPRPTIRRLVIVAALLLVGVASVGVFEYRLAGDDGFDVLLLLGDSVYPAGDPVELPATVFEPFAGVLDDGTELLAILGNNDVFHADARLAALGMPGHWWSVQRDDALIVGLDSNRPRDPAQLAWLDQTLAATTATWKIVALHHPPYSAALKARARTPAMPSAPSSSGTACSWCSPVMTTTTSGASSSTA